MLDWLIHSNRREYINVEFKHTNVPFRFATFNLYFGFKIEMMHNITSYDFKMELVSYHILLMYFVKNYTTCRLST